METKVNHYIAFSPRKEQLLDWCNQYQIDQAKITFMIKEHRMQQLTGLKKNGKTFGIVFFDKWNVDEEWKEFIGAIVENAVLVCYAEEKEPVVENQEIVGWQRIVTTARKIYASFPQAAMSDEDIGYVYVFGGQGTYKIGKANDVQKRIKAFIEMPFACTVIHTIPTTKPMIIESVLHKHFASKHTNGEWFALSEEDIDYIKRFNPFDYLPAENIVRADTRVKFLTRVDGQKVDKRMKLLSIKNYGELARKANVSESTIFNILNSYNYNSKTLDALAYALECTSRDITTLDEESTN